MKEIRNKIEQEAKKMGLQRACIPFLLDYWSGQIEKASMTKKQKQYYSYCPKLMHGIIYMILSGVFTPEEIKKLFPTARKNLSRLGGKELISLRRLHNYFALVQRVNPVELNVFAFTFDDISKIDLTNFKKYSVSDKISDLIENWSKYGFLVKENENEVRPRQMPVTLIKQLTRTVPWTLVRNDDVNTFEDPRLLIIDTAEKIKNNQKITLYQQIATGLMMRLMSFKWQAKRDKLINSMDEAVSEFICPNYQLIDWIKKISVKL